MCIHMYMYPGKTHVCFVVCCFVLMNNTWLEHVSACSAEEENKKTNNRIQQNNNNHNNNRINNNNNNRIKQ